MASKYIGLKRKEMRAAKKQGIQMFFPQGGGRGRRKREGKSNRGY